jgi:opacity protein-like surface antigen
MINKKLFAVASLVAAISASSAFAKTEGSYVGVDALATKYKDFDLDGNKKSDTGYGVGVNYKYALNMNNFFVAPGVYYNYNNAEVKYDGIKDKLKYSYGAKADIGYDITNKLAAFVSFGYQRNHLEATGEGVKISDNLNSLVYGIGAKYSVMENVDVSLAYEYVDYTKAEVDSSLNPSVVKLGAAYRF